MNDSHTPFVTLSEAARRAGTSRQNIHQWLQRSGALTHCERISLGGRTLALLIPVALLAGAPFGPIPDPAEKTESPD